MKVVQLIDSLEAGGAEKMAVNYANALSKKITFSGLVATRKEGLLSSQLTPKVSYLFLNRKSVIDFNAVFRLRKYLRKNKVNIIHAHSSSFFIAVLVKLTLPKINIVWHDHYGISQDLSLRKNISLKLGSIFFKGIISVNTALKVWAESYLFCEKVTFFPNFINPFFNSDEKLLLFGSEEKRIICVANLRPQKNHELLIKAAQLIKDKFPDWTFHLIGKDFKDSHSDKLKKIVYDLDLQKTVYFYGSVKNVGFALQKCNIAVLTSLSEGLPLAILEYGFYRLPVIATNVGEISKIITCKEEGMIIESDNINQLVDSLQNLIDNLSKRIEMGENLNKKIISHYGEEAIIGEYLLWLKSLTNFVVPNVVKIDEK